MNLNCDNDCAKPLVFPKTISNRVGLMRVDYRIGRYSDFRNNLIKKLNADDHFKAWTYRGSDDPGIALLECASILGDILTLYQEIYANESFLRTAQWRESVTDLVRLVGYRLSPGVGGHATFAALVKGDKKVTVPKGIPIKAQLEKSPQQAVFETYEEETAYPQLNKFKLYCPLVSSRKITQDPEFYISGVQVKLKKDDRLMVGYRPAGSSDPHNPDRLKSAQIVVVDEVRQSHGQQLFKIKGSLKGFEEGAQLIGFKIGRTFSHFGHNAPRTNVSINSDGKAQESPISYTRSIQYSTYTNDQSSQEDMLIVDPIVGKLEYPLDVQVSNIPIGSRLLIGGEFLAREVYYDFYEISDFILFVRKITNVKPLSMTWGSLSGSTSMIEIDSGLGSPSRDDDIQTTDYDSVDIRTLQFYEVLSPPIYVNAAGVDSSGKGYQLNFYGDQSAVGDLKGRHLLLVKPTSNESLLVKIERVDKRANLCSLTLDKIVDYADFKNKEDDNTTDVYGNLIYTTQGETQNETVLGNGDNRQTFQTFEIPKAPLTYLEDPGKNPPQAPQLEIYVNKILWERVDSFFGKNPQEQIYVVRQDSNGKSWVQFGDGNTGMRIPSGIKNVTAVWRTGIGAYGPLKKGTSVQVGRGIDSIDKIQLLIDVSGGNPPESGGKAKESAQGKVQSLGRLVSLEDFETETLLVPGVTKTSARWGLVGGVPGIILTVLMGAGREKEFEDARQTIANFDSIRGSARYPISVVEGNFQDVHLNITFGFDVTFRSDDIVTAIKTTLGVTGEEGNGIDGSEGLFGSGKRQFGQGEHVTRIEGTVQEVKGVVWVEAELVSGPNVSCGNSQILRLQSAHLSLTPVSVQPKEGIEGE